MKTGVVESEGVERCQLEKIYLGGQIWLQNQIRKPTNILVIESENENKIKVTVLCEVVAKPYWFIQNGKWGVKAGWGHCWQKLHLGDPHWLSGGLGFGAFDG